jgi:hypothetical protein
MNSRSCIDLLVDQDVAIMPRDKYNKSRNPRKQTAAGRSQPNPKRRVAKLAVRREYIPRGIHFFDANDPRHLPLPCRVAPYVVQRFIMNLQVTTNPVDSIVVLVGGTTQQNATAANLTTTITDVVALSGLGSSLVSVANLTKSPDLTALVTATTMLPPELTFSATSVSVQCVTNAAAAAGQVWMGRSHGPIDLPDAASSLTFANIGNAFIGRPGVRPLSYYQLYHAHDVHAIPMDAVKYQDFNAVSPGYSGQPSTGFTFDGGMTPLVFVFYPTGGTLLIPTNATSYNLRICVEARIRYPTTSANSSLHSPFSPTPQSTFDRVVSEVEDVVGGVMETAGGAGMGMRIAGVPGAVVGGLAGFAGRQGRNGPRG